MCTKLINNLLDLKNVNYDIVEENNRKLQLKKITTNHNYKYYKNMIFSECNDDTIDNLEPYIEFVETKNQREIWNYLKINTSSISTNSGYGRLIRFFVKDKKSKKILGIASIQSDIYCLKKRDDYIGWTKENLKKNIQHLVNIRICISMNPCGYNFNIGKLIISLCFSKEFQEEYKRKYGHYAAGLITMGINKKSVQYSRLKKLKYIGMTQGIGISHVSEKLYSDCLKFAKKNDLYKIGDNKLTLMSKIISHLKLDKNLLKHGHVRSIYFGYMGDNAKDFLCGNTNDFTPNMQSVEEISDWWKNRWARQRYEHLKKNNRLKYEYNLLSMDRINKVKNNMNNFKNRKKEELGKEEYKKIISEKNKLDYEKRNTLSKKTKKLNETDINNIIQKLKDGNTLMKLSLEYNVSRGRITRIRDSNS
jgi:hypothetical protein